VISNVQLDPVNNKETWDTWVRIYCSFPKLFAKITDFLFLNPSDTLLTFKFTMTGSNYIEIKQNHIGILEMHFAVMLRVGCLSVSTVQPLSTQLVASQLLLAYTT
jgi:hypothetical protein